MVRMHLMNFPGFWWLVGVICLLVLVAALGALLYVLTHRARDVQMPPGAGWQPPGGPVPPAAGRPTPHDILRERLARGEITVDEYERTMAALGPDPYAPPRA